MTFVQLASSPQNQSLVPPLQTKRMPTVPVDSRGHAAATSRCSAATLGPSRRNGSHLVLLGAVAVLSGSSACAMGPQMQHHGAQLTPKIVEDHGTRRYQAELERVFQAAVGALLAQGYEIASKHMEANLGRGQIQTRRKLLSTKAYGGAHYAQTISVYRQYGVDVRREADRVVVIARPRVFIGERDLSAEPVWDMDGPVGEKVLWRQLFADVEGQLWSRPQP